MHARVSSSSSLSSLNSPPIATKGVDQGHRRIKASQLGILCFDLGPKVDDSCDSLSIEEAAFYRFEVLF